MKKYEPPKLVIAEMEEEENIVVCSTLVNTGPDGGFEGGNPDEGWEDTEWGEGEW